jgi:hypothetical protein
VVLSGAHVWTIVSGERGTTGLREAIVTTQLMNDGGLTIEGYQQSWAQDPYDPTYSGANEEAFVSSLMMKATMSSFQTIRSRKSGVYWQSYEVRRVSSRTIESRDSVPAFRCDKVV